MQPKVNSRRDDVDHHGLGKVKGELMPASMKSEYPSKTATKCAAPKYKILACTMVKNDLPYLFEWIE